MDITQSLDILIDKCGGMGKFQLFLITISMLSKVGVAWSMLMMSITGAVPDWWCVTPCDQRAQNYTEEAKVSLFFYQNCNNSFYQKCEFKSPNSTEPLTCSDFKYDGALNTIVNEWNLLCDRKSFISLATTIQMAGLFTSGLLAGHFADWVGRKPVFFFSLLTMAVFNVGAGFSTTWGMFAAFRYGIGFSIGGYLTVFYTYFIEFIPAKHRPIIVAFPVWPLWVALMSLVAWLVPEWRYLHFITAALCSPWILAWWFVPESFRWLVTNNKRSKAEKVILRIAKVNGSSPPDLQILDKVFEKQASSIKSSKVHSIRDICTPSTYLKTNILFGICWLTGAYVYYAISFGVQTLSGDLFVNFAVLQLMAVPGSIAVYFLVIRIGRKKTAIGFYFLGSLSATVVSLVTVLDLPEASYLTTMTTVCALVCRMACSAAWASIMILTSETYPTVVRNIGYGLQNSVARIGSMLAPQMVFLNDMVPGLMYFLCAGLSLLSVVCAFFLPETRGMPLLDNLTVSIETPRDEERRPLLGHDSVSSKHNGLKQSTKI